jgi:hypothetical protein
MCVAASARPRVPPNDNRPRFRWHISGRMPFELCHQGAPMNPASGESHSEAHWPGSVRSLAAAECSADVAVRGLHITLLSTSGDKGGHW